MSFKVITPAESTALATALTIQGQLGLEPGTDQQLLSELIQSASDFMVEYTHRSFAQQTVQELLSGYGTSRLMLDLNPIVSVTSILNNNNPITDFTIEDEEGGILFRERGWEWAVGVGWGIQNHVIPRTEVPKFLVDYIGGYVLPSFSTGIRNLPRSLEQICIDLVRIWYGEIKANLAPGSGPVEQIKVGDYSIKYASSTSAGGEDLGIPNAILVRLNNWRRII